MRRAFSHYLVLRGGIPCTLAGRDSVHKDGVLVPARAGEPIANFMVNRLLGRSATIYARRHLMRAIKRTQEAALVSGLDAEVVWSPHSVIMRCRDQGVWSIRPIILPKPCCPHCGQQTKPG